MRSVFMGKFSKLHQIFCLFLFSCKYFLARGPNFKSAATISSIKNVNVYPLLCKLLDITCHASNGTAEVFDSVYVATSTINYSKNSMIFNINVGVILGILNIFKYFN